MSLIHWWPLNGDLKDQGCQPVDLVIGAGAQSFSMSGKIGQCASMNGSTYYKAQNVTTGANTTICCWAKTSTQGRMMWGMQCSASELMNFFTSTIYTLNTGDSNNNPFKDENNHSISVISDNQWHHFVVMFKGTENAKLYIDGIYRGQAQIYRNPTMSSKLFTLGTWNHSSYSSYCWNGSLNDVRIYDEALDEKQIKKIAQGLVLHYTMDNCGVKQLPEEYQRVEYIESTGTQWIDTNVNNSDTAMDVELVLATTDNTPTASGRYYGTQGGLWVQLYQNQIYFKSTIPIQKNTQYKLHLWTTKDKIRKLNVNGFNGNYDNNTSNASTVFTLFTLSGNNDYVCASKLWSATIKIDNILKFDAVPCYRKSDGKPGLYDFVSNQFFTNSGSGEFLLGPSVGLPNGYQQVEYLESTGAQWIDTHISASTNVGFDLVFKTGSSIVMQAVIGSGTYSFGRYGLYINDTKIWFLSIHNGGVANAVVDKNYNISLRWPNIKINGTSYSIGGSVTNDNILLFKHSQYLGSVKMYGVRFTNIDAIRKDFIPCYRKSDGKPGMYDVINNVFYVNQGTGVDFLLGPSVGLPERYRQCEYIQSNGTPYLMYNTTTGIEQVSAIYSMDEARSGHSVVCCPGTPGVGGGIYSPQIGFNGSDVDIPNAVVTASTNGIYNSLATTATTTTLANDLGIFYVGAWGRGSTLKGKIYGMHVKTGTYFTSLTPSYDTLTKTYGMYDSCTGKFLTNAGSGSFTAGPFMGHEMVPNWNGAIERDISGYHYDGTKVNQPILSETSPRYRLSTRFGQSSVKNYIINSFGLTSAQEMSLMAWVYPYARNTDRDRDCIIIGGVYLTIAQNGKISAYCYGKSPAGYNDGSAIVPLNSWSHIAIVYSTTKLSFYLNGVLDKEISCTGTMQSGYLTKHIGCEGSSRQFDGNISDVRIYATALSADDIAEIYNQKKEGY